MLRTTPTRIELKQEDVREYEEMKEEWRKELQNNSKSPGHHMSEGTPQHKVKNPQKDDRHSRMGYKK